MAPLVIGASGLIGYEFYRQTRYSGWHYTYMTHKLHDFTDLDATDYVKTDKVIGGARPEILVLPAALANVNQCEKDHDAAFKNNVGIVKNCIAVMKRLKNGKIVFFSTDYLFDGKDGPYAEDAKPRPLNYYGMLKLMCEQEIVTSGLDYLIVRTTGVFGWELQRKNFFYRVLDTLGQGKQLEVAEDQFATPTYVRDLVAATLKLLELGKSGIYNVAGPEFVSRETLARKFADFLGFDQKLIVPKPTSAFNDVAPRPLKAGLRSDRITQLGINMRAVGDALLDMKQRRETDDVYV